MLKSLLIVGTGSFIGGTMRYLLSTIMKNVCDQGFPWGTLSVNLLGCFLFGILFAIFSKNSSTDNTLYLFLTTGFCVVLQPSPRLPMKVSKCCSMATPQGLSAMWQQAL